MEYRKKFFNGRNLLALLIICFFLYYLIKSITGSVFLKGRDKINVVFYGENIRFYSLDQKNINYLLSFSNSVKVIVPGGYGEYKVGAVGKLASLEEKPEIIRKTFSAVTATLVDLYFYPKKTTIYYQDGSNNSNEMPTIKEIFLTNSNTNLIDRLFLLYFFATGNREDYQTISLKPFELGDGNNTFDYNGFYKKFQGSFFQKTYRDYDINVQIIYTKSYKTALLLSQMIEGEGIRVVDLSNRDEFIKGCLLITSKKISTTKTYQRLADFFKCNLKIGETTVSDIILELGDLEKEWAIN
ncbi:MAG: hypothetical protein Q7J11_00080 [Candidatus Roizmanbacteria bacterium]|nr:hypothetical protein [Candidatus Roizmanbacteria bacterium]